MNEECIDQGIAKDFRALFHCVVNEYGERKQKAHFKNFGTNVEPFPALPNFQTYITRRTTAAGATLQRILKPMNEHSCENCIIGVLSDGENQRIVNAPALVKHVERQRELRKLYNSAKATVVFGGLDDHDIKAYSLQDYCEGIKCTDLFRFTCCPVCGHGIDWKSILDKYQ